MRDTKQEILQFWFKECEPRQWFQANELFDLQIRERFETSYDMAREGMCDSWTQSAEGTLALCLLVSQFPRHMFRGTIKAYETDGIALDVCEHGLKKGYDIAQSERKRHFFYLPYAYSENMADQEKSILLFETLKDFDPVAYDNALRRYHTIRLYGRFPHRNAVLGRKTTEDEIEYLSNSRNLFAA